MTRRYLREYLEGIHAHMIADAGGPESMTAIQRIAVDRITTLLGGVRVIEESMRSKGVLTATGDLRNEIQGGYLAWNNTLAKWIGVLSATGGKDTKGKLYSAKDLSAFVVKELKAADVTAVDAEPESGSMAESESGSMEDGDGHE